MNKLQAEPSEDNVEALYAQSIEYQQPDQLRENWAEYKDDNNVFARLHKGEVIPVEEFYEELPEYEFAKHLSLDNMAQDGIIEINPKKVILVIGELEH